MKKYTILVSGASGIVGYGILKSLKGYEYRLIGTTIHENSPADYFADIVEIAPMSTSEQYIPWLLDVIEKYDVDFAIPGIEIDMSVWNINRNVLSHSGTVFLLNNDNLIRLCLDKWHFYEKMEKMESVYRISSSIEPDFNRYSLPFILKPRCGYGSKGLIKVEDRNMFEQFEAEIGDRLMMQEYVGSPFEEYTVSAFLDMESNVKALIAMKRKLSSLGFTETAEIVHLEDMMEVIIELSNIFKPIGPTNFQFRKHKGNWKLLEINPRISSATSIRSKFGYNEAKMSIDYFLEKKEIEQPTIRTGRAIRYTEDFIMYDNSGSKGYTDFESRRGLNNNDTHNV